MDLICPVKRLLPSKCPNCGNESISLYDNKDRRINYPLMCKYNTFNQIKKKIEKSEIKYMKCDICKCVFVPDWTRKEVPYPTNKTIYKEFEV